MSKSISDSYNYILGKAALLSVYTARISAFLPFRGRSVPKIKYNYIKVD